MTENVDGKSIDPSFQKQTEKLSNLKVGSQAVIVKITASGALKSKILSMGFVKGEVVRVEKIAPLGSPIDVLVKNTHISLRKDEAEKVVVRVL